MSSKDQILTAAEYVFAEEGYGGARIKDIAERANVTTAMVHYFFESKDNLFKAVLNRILADLIVLARSVEDSLPRVERLRRYFHGFFDYAAKHRNFARLSLMAAGANREHFENLVREFFRPQFKDGVLFIREGIEAGEFLPVDAEQFLTAIYGMTITYFAESHFVSIMLGRDAMADELLTARRSCMLDMIFRTLGIEAAAQPEPEPAPAPSSTEPERTA